MINLTYEELIFYKREKAPGNFVDRTGFENEYFKVIGEAPPKDGKTYWNCLCKSCN